MMDHWNLITCQTPDLIISLGHLPDLFNTEV
jgi:hypothetical protein